MASAPLAVLGPRDRAGREITRAKCPRHNEGMVPEASTGDAILEAFWQDARVRGRLNRLEVITGQAPQSSLRPPSWALSESPVESHRFAEGIVSGRVAGLGHVPSGPAGDPEATSAAGDLSILTDGAGRPRALLRTRRVETVTVARAEELSRAVVDAVVVHGGSGGMSQTDGDGARHAGVHIEWFDVLHPRVPRRRPGHPGS